MFARSSLAVTFAPRAKGALWTWMALAVAAVAPGCSSTSSGNGTSNTVNCIANPFLPACQQGQPGTDTVDSGSDIQSTTDDTGGQAGTDTGNTGTAGDTGNTQGTGGDNGNIGTGTTTTTAKPYAGTELHVRIVGPGGHGYATVSGQVAVVNGVAFGPVDKVTWSNLSNGTIDQPTTKLPYFMSSPITLVPGDNHIQVKATGGGSTVTDDIVITYNNTFSFPDRLRLNPDVVKVGGDGTVSVSLQVGKNTSISGAIKLNAVAADGSMSPLASLVDDGNIPTSGDEVAADGIYTAKIKASTAAANTLYYRASVQFSANGQTMTAMTEVQPLEVIAPFTQSDCNAAVQALKDADAAAAGAGGGAAGQAAAIAALKGNAAVDSAGANSGDNSLGAWVHFKSGVLGAVNGNGTGNRGDGAGGPGQQGGDPDLTLSTVQVLSKRALLLDPFANAFGKDEVAAANTQMSNLQCPAYTIDQASNGSADMHQFRHMYEYGFVAVASHGDAYFKDLDPAVKTGYNWQHPGSQEVIWTGHSVQCSAFASAAQKTCALATQNSAAVACSGDSECFINAAGGGGICVDELSGDLRRGRAVIGSGGTYGILPGFVTRHAPQAYPHAMVYLGSCKSIWNGTLAGEFLAAGASAIAGYNGYMANDFATKWGTSFFDNLIGQKQLSGTAHVQIEDKANPGTYFTLIGAQNLDAAYSEILNASFESGNLQGWIKMPGDGRVISQLGAAGPAAGKFMGIVSTGLGFTTQNGEITQRFCIPAGKSQFSFWWKFYSEEFKEYCGSQFQDEFLCRFEGKVGNKTSVDVKIDDLCDGGSQFKGLTKADVAFDQGDVWMTNWVNTKTDITPFAGNGNVKLRFFTQDVGDSIYDTAVLFDMIEFN